MSAAQPETAPGVVCMYYVSKRVYETADEASVALREIAVKYMELGHPEPDLMVYPCCDHYHLGRKKREGASA